ncbi:hypothetical protein FACS1894189_8250 [Planctomycetales bacterium]|nr:hypothetical protein FACS1894189_8250 [Planctomycetales bacterium]
MGKGTRANLDNARLEYQKALNDFNDATTDEERAVAGAKLKEIDDKLAQLSSTYEGMSEQRYNDKVKGLTTNARELEDRMAISGSFNALEASSMGMNAGMLAEAKRTNQLLEKLYLTVDENGGLVFA